MMRTKEPFYGRRFCVSGGVLHDLVYEQAKCGIDELKPASIQTFNDKQEALKTGAQPCRYCLWKDSKF